MNTDEANRPVLSFVALETEALPSWRDIKARLIGDLSVQYELSDIDETDGSIFASVEGGILNLALMPAPIPWTDIEGPCQTAWYWPDAEETMRSHAAHILITTMGTKLDRIDVTLLLTRLTAAVALAANAVGIYWGSGT